MQVYKVEFELKEKTYILYVTETGKILESRLSYRSGRDSQFVADHIVDVPDDWQDAQSSLANMSWLTTEMLKELGAPRTVFEVNYRYTFEQGDGLIAHPNQIGDRTVVNPGEICHRSPQKALP